MKKLIIPILAVSLILLVSAFAVVANNGHDALVADGSSSSPIATPATLNTVVLDEAVIIIVGSGNGPPLRAVESTVYTDDTIILNGSVYGLAIGHINYSDALCVETGDGYDAASVIAAGVIGNIDDIAANFDDDENMDIISAEKWIFSPEYVETSCAIVAGDNNPSPGISGVCLAIDDYNLEADNYTDVPNIDLASYLNNVGSAAGDHHVPATVLNAC